jgi:hypothetical protein
MRTLAYLLMFAVAFQVSLLDAAPPKKHDHKHDHGKHVSFSIRSVRSGVWSDPKTWEPNRVPRSGDRVLVGRGDRVTYDVVSNEKIRLLQVVGTLTFARDRSTLLDVGVLKVQDSDECSESGFACDFEGATPNGEPLKARTGVMPTLEIGTLDNPIPAEHTARIRLRYLEGFDKNDAPALVCCSARMELHGSPMNRTWVKLGKDVDVGDASVVLDEDVTGWRVGDEVIVTGSKHEYAGGSFRDDPDAMGTESRIIKVIDAKHRTLVLDRPLDNAHFGSGEFRSEVANLSRNVIIESADPEGVRGHTLYHAYSSGGISYARFAHLGKEGVLGRYSIHYHLIGDTMRGSQVLGAAIVDSHNRWVTVHGTQYLVVRDCVGYQSVGHGYFMEDGTEVLNLFDRNLGVQAYKGRRLPQQVLPFDPNDGAAFWWANGRNTLTRNVACENDQYGYRYDSQRRSNFDSNLGIRTNDGQQEVVDIRTVAISRFSHNESHTEGLYSAAFAGTDGVGPDTQHPHRINDFKAWQTHYAFRAQLPTMLVENLYVNHAAYGVYRPFFENHVYRNVHIAATGAEPFNRGLDDRSDQHGSITVDGLTFSQLGYGGQMPLIQISANSVNGSAESHFRNVKVLDRKDERRWPTFNLGGGPRLTPKGQGVPVYVHDHFGPGRDAKVVSTRAKDLLADGNEYQPKPPLTGNESVVAEVAGIEFPELLDPVDDLSPATVITQVRREGDKTIVEGVTHDNGIIETVAVNGRPAKLTRHTDGVLDWRIELSVRKGGTVEAIATDRAGNVELTPHQVMIP